ncbi:hypothetical protein RhiirA4_480649 [Rhizophagus irregularis]|uniref:RING-type domain-containing protein n=1 Tax=Rhizophagus irregularis TaxID=588596 RepID=A0A2I1HIA3_9GLOM|nr:hypothetical protein RhiirA4_480649 [Rhizophagus irregularis]
MATCGYLYHQKCLEGFLLNVAKTRAKLSCPNWDCKGREIETQDLFKEMDKPTTLTAEDTASKRVYSENATPVSEEANEIYMNQLGLFSKEEQSSSRTTVKASSSIQIIKETSDQTTSPIEVVSTTPGDDSISKVSSGQVQHPICEKCSEEISIEFMKDTVFLSCKHVMHYECIDNPHKKCPTCPLSETMSEISTLVEPDLSDGQKKQSEKDWWKEGIVYAIEELLTDVPVPIAEENLEEASEDGAVPEPGSIFLQLSNMIDNAETKNEDAYRGLIFSKRYKELKTEFGKDESKALVKKEVRKAIPETKCSDKALRKGTERSKKMYKLLIA